MARGGMQQQRQWTDRRGRPRGRQRQGGGARSTVVAGAAGLLVGAGVVAWRGATKRVFTGIRGDR